MTPLSNELQLIICNVPDEEVATAIAHELVESRLAACVNILGGCRSVYRWQGKVETDDEITLLVKTTGRRHGECVRRLEQLHPYEVPEIVTFSPQSVSAAYAQWAIAQTSTD